jgi:kynurenine formamidase
MHRVIMGAGVVIMEGLNNLAALPRRRVDFAALFYMSAGSRARRRASSRRSTEPCGAAR